MLKILIFGPKRYVSRKLNFWRENSNIWKFVKKWIFRHLYKCRILWSPNEIADVCASNHKSMNKNFQALFHARQNLKVEDSHRYQMSYWFATHLKNDGACLLKWEFRLSVHIFDTWYQLWEFLLIAFIQRWSGGWYKVLFWNSLHEYTLRVFPLKHF